MSVYPTNNTSVCHIYSLKIKIKCVRVYGHKDNTGENRVIQEKTGGNRRKQGEKEFLADPWQVIL
jgi:hypothetical protein